jgi:GalNAc-alpha-(1->4)-GalNAc-alpha-(1->3)-diNAcBac-PP-undecaprenol alpha-1,4-N-acetyl-D-galactosaminyltransferase
MVTTNILTLLATRLLGIPVIVSERTLPAMSAPGRAWQVLRRATYPLTDRLVVQTRDAGDFFWPSLQRRIRVIPNPVRALGGESRGGGVTARQPVVVTVGRLEAVKQLDHVLRAFASIADSFPEWRLAMVGDGSLRDSLKELGDDLGVGSRVEWAGFVVNPEDYLRRAGLFVMASHHEGFPCALQEAMACGLPVLSYDCPGGIREILRDGRDGVLVPPGDIGQLGKAMASLIENPDRRAQLGEAALAVRERYSIDRIMQIWEDELQRLVRPRAGAARGAKYLIRFDDICPTMNWEVWREIEKILVEHGVKPILAVVPDNRDPKLRVDEPHPHFWEEVRKWQSWGWTIGLHGYQHAYVTTNAGCMGINRYSEFAGLPASEQREKLRRGIAIFRKEGVTPDLWIAPAHSFDTHTLEALQAEGLDVVSDGFFPAPGRDGRGIFWAPQQMWWFANRRRGVWTVCLHHNKWTQPRLEQFRDEVKRRRERLTSVQEMLDVYGGRKLSVMDKAFAKGYLLLLLARHQIKKLISFASILMSHGDMTSMRTPKRTISSK